MDIRKVKKLIELLEESGLAELEIHEGQESVRISRHSNAPIANATGPSTTPAGAASAQGSFSPGLEPELAPELDMQDDLLPDGHIVTSPMVGTYYASLSPGGPALVSVGQRVKVGDTLCIIEAMKILNHIEADLAGVIEAVLLENSQPVEYGQPLFVIK